MRPLRLKPRPHSRRGSCLPGAFRALRRTTLGVTTVWILVSHSPVPAASAPGLARLVPSAVVPGRTTVVKLAGDQFDGVTELWTSLDGATVRRWTNGTGKTGPATFAITVPASTPPGIAAARAISREGLSSWQLFVIDSFATTTFTSTNTTTGSALPLARAAAVDGVGAEVTSHFFRVEGRRGKVLHVDVVAQRLGSALDPWLRLTDGDGRELASCDDAPSLGTEAALDYRCPRNGPYFIELRDAQHRGGPTYRYRLRVSEAPLPPLPFLGTALPASIPRWTAVDEREPNNDAPRAQPLPPGTRLRGSFSTPGDRDLFRVTVARNQRLVVRGRTRSLGSACDLWMQLATTNGNPIIEADASGGSEGALTNTFKEAGPYLLIVEELTRAGGADRRYEIDLETWKPGFSLGVSQETLVIPAGGFAELPVTVERDGFDGAITLSVDGLPAGWAATHPVLDSKARETRLRVTAPGSATEGQWFHVRITGKGTHQGEIVTTEARTTSALRALWPALRHGPEALDGWIGVGVRSANPAAK